MSTYATLLEMYNDHLPNIYFKPGVVDVATSVTAIGDAMDIKLPLSNLDNETAKNQIVRQVTAAYEALKTNPEYAAYFEPLRKVSGNMGQGVIGTFNILKGSVRPEVEHLKEEIEKATKEILTQDGHESLISPDMAIANNFNYVSWDVVLGLLGGAQSVMDEFKEISGTGGNLVYHDLSIALSNAGTQLTPLSLHADTAKAIVDDLASRMGVDAAHIERIISLITEQWALNGLIHEAISTYLTTGHNAVAIERFSNNLTTMVPVVQQMMKMPMDVTDELLTVIHGNLAILRKVFVIMAYGLMCIRNELKNTFVISCDLLNSDRTADFEASGIDLSYITKYLRVFHPQNGAPVPNSGITLEELTTNKTEVEERFATLEQTYHLQATGIRQSAMGRAMKKVLTDHLENADASLIPSNLTAKEFIDMKKYLIMSTLNRLGTEDNNLENVLYDFVLSLWYDGTMVQTAHQLFGSELIRQIEANNELTDETLGLIDAKVAASICANFVMTHLCDVK